MKRIAYLATALLLMAVTTHAQNAFTVADTNVPLGGHGEITVNFQFADEGQITAYQFYLNLPEDISLVPNGTKFVYEKGDGYDNAHQVAISYISENNVYRVVCAALTGTPTFSVTSGMLSKLSIQANSSLTQGTILNASLSNVSLSTVGGSDVFLADVPFRIVIGEPSDIRTELFETSTELPTAANNVNVRVYRTIKANEWSTICLPFAMTETQVKDAFGDDVELGDFTGCTAVEDDDENIVGLSVNFNSASSIIANHPYIIKVTSAVTKFTADGVNLVAEEEPSVDKDKLKVGIINVYNRFIGTYTANTTVPNMSLFLNGNKFWYSSGTTKMKGFRGYFDFYNVLTDMENQLGEEGSRITFSFEEPTAIRQINSGQQDGAVYDLQGRRVEKPSKGVYVKDGKKMVAD
jgi:hypothetical protein